VILFDSVTKLYASQTRPALDDVSLEIEKGEFIFLVGPSGSGKSTFLRLVLREERPTSGQVWVLGKELNRLSNWKIPAMRRQIGTVFQDFRLLPNKTVFENVAFALEVIGKPSSHIKRVVPEVLEVVGLEGKEQRRPDELSGGEQQRVAIARALINDPGILYADEPTGNLDAATGSGVMDMLMSVVAESQKTLVVVTHDQSLAKLGDRRLILKEQVFCSIVSLGT
jgi:cell division transport system ATP-binding protein